MVLSLIHIEGFAKVLLKKGPSLAGGLFGYVEIGHGLLLLDYELNAIMKNGDCELFN